MVVVGCYGGGSCGSGWSWEVLGGGGDGWW